MAGKTIEKFIVYNMRETYAELGEFEFKVVLSPRHFKNCHGSEMKVVDSAGREMSCETKKWGRKLTCRFAISTETADGVARVSLLLGDDSGHSYSQQLEFWVIK
jgi:hypothetical protein